MLKEVLLDWVMFLWPSFDPFFAFFLCLNCFSLAVFSLSNCNLFVLQKFTNNHFIALILLKRIRFHYEYFTLLKKGLSVFL